MDKGHLFIYDSWYNSIALCNVLIKLGFNYISILRNNATDMPDKNKKSNSSKKYEYNNNNHIKFQQYEDKNLIIFVANKNLNIENLRKSYNILNKGLLK